MVENPPANAGDVRDKDSIPGSGRSPGGGHGQPTPVFLPEESHRQRRLVGYSPQGGTARISEINVLLLLMGRSD